MTGNQDVDLATHGMHRNRWPSRITSSATGALHNSDSGNSFRRFLHDRLLVGVARASDGEPVLALEPGGHAGWICALILRNDYELISVSHDHTVRLWSL